MTRRARPDCMCRVWSGDAIAGAASDHLRTVRRLLTYIRCPDPLRRSGRVGCGAQVAAPVSPW